MKGDAAAALHEFRNQYDAGADPATVLTDLAEFTHLVTRLRFVPDAAKDASLSEDGAQRAARRSPQTLSLRVLSRTWQMLLKGIPEVQGASRAGQRRRDGADPHRARRQSADAGRGAEIAGRRRGKAGRRAARRAPALPARRRQRRFCGRRDPRASSAMAAARRCGLVEAEPAAAPALPKEEPQPAVEAVPVASLADIAALADANRDMAFKVLLKRCVRLVRIEPGRLDVNLIGDAPKTLLGDLTVKLKAWTGRNWMVSLSREEGGATLAELEGSKRETAILDAKSDPAVASILARFPGARVIDVRIPNAPEADAPDDGPMPDPSGGRRRPQLTGKGCDHEGSSRA